MIYSPCCLCGCSSNNGYYRLNSNILMFEPLPFISYISVIPARSCPSPNLYLPSRFALLPGRLMEYVLSSLLPSIYSTITLNVNVHTLLFFDVSDILMNLAFDALLITPDNSASVISFLSRTLIRG